MPTPPPIRAERGVRAISLAVLATALLVLAAALPLERGVELARSMIGRLGWNAAPIVVALLGVAWGVLHLARRAPGIRARFVRYGLPAAALAAAVLAAWAWARRESLKGVFGPPRVRLEERYAGETGEARFDHARLDRLLAGYVDATGLVDYAGLESEAAELDAYLAAVAEAPFDALGRDEKLALLLDAYNAFTLRLILERYPLDSIRSIPAAERWDAVRWTVAGQTLSLNQLEHEWIRPRFREPRIHFALVCAARGCPPLRREAYVGARLEEQLADQARVVHGDSRWFRLEADGESLRLTALYDWYRTDFVQVAGSVPAFAARSSPELADLLEAGREPRVEWLEYDWSLNERE